MELFKCKVSHRSSQQNAHVSYKMYYIYADCYEAAYLMAKELSKDINQCVYEPVVYRVRDLKIDAIVTLDKLKELYGTMAVDKAIRDCQDAYRDTISL